MKKKVNKTIFKIEWLIFPILIGFGWLTYVTASRYYKNSKTVVEYVRVQVTPDWTSQNRKSSNSAFNISFIYNERKYGVGISRTCYRLYEEKGVVELLYNSELDHFLDPFTTKFQINSDIIFTIFCGIIEIIFLKSLITGKYKTWS